MTQFDDRERAFEAKFARDEEMQFRVLARRNRLLGEWAAGLMGLTAAESDAYAKEVIQADFEEAGDEDVIRKLLGDLTSAGVEMDEDKIRATLDHKSVEARRQLMEAQALRRVDEGDLSEEQVEALGLGLSRLEEAMEDLKARYDLTTADLNIDLGPLGTLLSDNI